MDIKQLPSYESESRGYIGWAPGDNYMGGEGWRNNNTFETWEDFDPAQMDVDLNLVADFYFVERTTKCPDCETGYSPEAQRINDDFYDHAGRGTRWCENITDEDFEALKAAGRTDRWTSAEDANRAQRGRRELGHDAINRGVMVEARAIKAGVPVLCPTCNGDAALKTGDIGIHVWLLHPRKGAARGITVKRVTEADVPAIKAWLRESFEAHRRHFAWALD